MKHPIHETDVPWERWYAGTDREVWGKALCDVGGRARVGVGLMHLLPGCNTEPAHWHSREEEHLYALSGAATLRLGEREHTLTAGSYVCFPAGQALAHSLVNTGSEPFVYVMIGERIAGDEVTYPGGADP
jgi:uncharacterized cupin superfamily protein